MRFSFFKSNDCFESELFNEAAFYQQFQKDLRNARHQVIIESPFITTYRMNVLRKVLNNLIDRDISIKIITRDPIEHDKIMRYQATEEILCCKEMGVDIVLVSGYHHRKLAIIDDSIIWEGSLNILSQNTSHELMRRIANISEVRRVKKFLRY